MENEIEVSEVDAASALLVSSGEVNKYFVPSLFSEARKFLDGVGCLDFKDYTARCIQAEQELTMRERREKRLACGGLDHPRTYNVAVVPSAPQIYTSGKLPLT